MPFGLPPCVKQPSLCLFKGSRDRIARAKSLNILQGKKQLTGDVIIYAGRMRDVNRNRKFWDDFDRAWEVH